MKQAVTALLVAEMLASLSVAVGGPTRDRPVITAELNGIRVVCDAETGSIVSMRCPGAGTLIDVAANDAGIVDLACPVPDFEPLRLASRYSSQADVTVNGEHLRIVWQKLGASRPALAPAGRVAATVTLSAAPDARSIILSCQVENQSDGVIRQILFPDLLGLVPLEGGAGGEFRGEAIRMRPFVRLAKPTSDYFYAVNRTFASFPPRRKSEPAAPRWFGYGTARGGIVLFPRRRDWNHLPPVMLHLWERNRRLRVMVAHDVRLVRGQSFKSDRYWLTPFSGSWERGLEPYREWIADGQPGDKN